MNEQEKARIYQRIQALYRYNGALEHGESDVAFMVLNEAQQDPALERMVLELNEVYQIEDATVVHPDDVATAHEMLLDVLAGLTNEDSGPATVSQTDERQPEVLPQPVTLAPVRTEKRTRRSPRQWHQSRVAATVAVVLLVVLAVPVLSAFAPQFLALFRPQQFTGVSSETFRDPVQIVENLDSFLQQIGDDTTQNYASKQLAIPTLSQSAAEQQVHFHIQLPSTLPDGVGQARLFTVIPADHESFTFNAAKARTYLQESGQTSVTVPAQLDGTEFQVTLNAGVVVTYYDQCGQADGKAKCSGGELFAVTEEPDPTIQSTGSASLSDLRTFLLSLPKLSAGIRTLLQNTNVNSGIVPVPLPQGASSTQATVQGASALLITLSGSSGIIWESQNMVYIVLSAHASGPQIQNIANSLN